MKRRDFIKTSGLSLGALLIDDVLVGLGKKFWKTRRLRFPDKIFATINEHNVELKKNGNDTWEYENLMVELKTRNNSIDVWVTAYNTVLCNVSLIWDLGAKLNSTILNDHWERSYGDISWHKPTAGEILPWYFLEITKNGEVNGFGVKTGAGSFCYWQIHQGWISLFLDTRSGGNGVSLEGRSLLAAQIVTHTSGPGAHPFSELRAFLKTMCDKPRMPTHPVYGINDWYFSYGNSSEKLILEHTAMMVPMAGGLDNRPFSVIDAGWFNNFENMPSDCCFGDMSTPNTRFKDMGALAQKIRGIGMRPGIWTRPLCASINDSKSLLLPSIKGRESEKQPILDPSIPENLERIKKYFKLYCDWSYELVKFDFTTYDIFGKWGFEMLNERKMTEYGWSMWDKSKTNAEIVLNLYRTIREAAGNMYIIGCNTISHLSAGIFELNRIGDDTSGIEWERTRKMGVNTLAFRGAHHGIFYAADSDCVGLTSKIPWEKNKQWMDLLAKSGTPLFISAHPESTGREQKAFIKECFTLASQNLPVAEPLDWLENPLPKKWRLNGKIENYNWD